jgi:hypothetical protein
VNQAQGMTEFVVNHLLEQAGVVLNIFIYDINDDICLEEFLALKFALS